MLQLLPFVATEDRFRIDAVSGKVWIESGEQALPTNGTFVIQKIATDSLAASATLMINLSMTAPYVTETAARKMLMFTVRETAPPGEEVGTLDDSEDFRSKLFHVTVLKKANPGGSYLPFNITKDGAIVVTEPLAFRNAICDIFIVNISVSDVAKVGNYSNCVRQVTRISARITVQKSDCPSNWTFVLKKNVYLNLPPLATVPRSSLQTCQDACLSCLLPCNSFIYNVVTTTCFLMNETDFTEPQAVQRRMGSFFYRKYCQTERLPSYAFRHLYSMIPTRTMLTPRTSILILSNLMARWKPRGIEPDEDIAFVTDFISKIVRCTDTSAATQATLGAYVKIYGQVMDKLILETREEQRTKEVQIQLMESFDDILESLSTLVVNGTLEVYTNATLVIVDSVSNNTHFRKRLQLGNMEPTEVNFKGYHSRTTGTEGNTTVIVTGAMGGITHSLDSLRGRRHYGNSKADQQSYHVIHGPVVAVVVGHRQHEAGSVEVRLDIPVNTMNKLSTDRSCVFFQRSDGRKRPAEWKSDGCFVEGYNSTHTTCRCTHLTNFAVLMQLTDFKISDVHTASLDILTVIGCCVSIAALTTTAAVLVWLRLYTERYILFLNLAGALVLAQGTFLLGIDAVQVQPVCRLVAVLLHYLFLAVFALMLAEGIFLYHKLHMPFSRPIGTRMFLGLGWGSPVTIVMLSMSMNMEGYGNKASCWLSKDGTIWAFIGPALCIIVINMSLLVMILRTFVTVKNNAKKSESQQFIATVKVAMVLMPLLGITWLTGVMSVDSSTVVFQYLFVVLNSLQGLFLFLTHVVFNQDVRRVVSEYRARNQAISDSIPKHGAAVKLHRYVLAKCERIGE